MCCLVPLCQTYLLLLLENKPVLSTEVGRGWDEEQECAALPSWRALNDNGDMFV